MRKKEITTETRRARSKPLLFLRVLRVSVVNVLILLICALVTAAQNPAPNTETQKKVNARPAEPGMPKADPFDGATVEKMTGQCVTVDTESGAIVIEMLPAKARETVRSFLNLAATGALDSTTFSRVVKGFVIQGGNLSTSEKWSAELAERMSRHLPDEPSDVMHERGIVSMARGDEPNSAPWRQVRVRNVDAAIRSWIHSFWSLGSKTDHCVPSMIDSEM